MGRRLVAREEGKNDAKEHCEGVENNQSLQPGQKLDVTGEMALTWVVA